MTEPTVPWTPRPPAELTIEQQIALDSRALELDAEISTQVEEARLQALFDKAALQLEEDAERHRKEALATARGETVAPAAEVDEEEDEECLEHIDSGDCSSHRPAVHVTEFSYYPGGGCGACKMTPPPYRDACRYCGRMGPKRLADWHAWACSCANCTAGGRIDTAADSGDPARSARGFLLASVVIPVLACLLAVGAVTYGDAHGWSDLVDLLMGIVFGSALGWLSLSLVRRIRRSATTLQVAVAWIASHLYERAATSHLYERGDYPPMTTAQRQAIERQRRAGGLRRQVLNVLAFVLGFWIVGQVCIAFALDAVDAWDLGMTWVSVGMTLFVTLVMGYWGWSELRRK
jgi:hypothetical protein